MKKFSSGSWGKGIITFLAITVLLAGLFAIFGRNPYIADYDASGVRGKGEAGGQSTSAKAKAVAKQKAAKTGKKLATNSSRESIAVRVSGLRTEHQLQREIVAPPPPSRAMGTFPSCGRR